MAASGQPLAAWEVIVGPLDSDRGQGRRPSEVVIRLPGLTKGGNTTPGFGSLEAPAKARNATKKPLGISASSRLGKSSR
ncbi:hypothetical protein V493_03878 [Pseudogymnoascus sp. VKM F-4281 (FW-2241)]|nr:hypothetical protein V493_03878 [Pseudogymnoascus sp. VKM F-4281 (FW-2241)]